MPSMQWLLERSTVAPNTVEAKLFVTLANMSGSRHPMLEAESDIVYERE